MIDFDVVIEKTQYRDCIMELTILGPIRTPNKKYINYHKIQRGFKEPYGTSYTSLVKDKLRFFRTACAVSINKSYLE